MADLSEQPTLSPGVKRTHDGEPVIPSAQMASFTPPGHSQPLPLRRSQSPALSTTSSSLTDLSSAPLSSSALQNSLTGPPGSQPKKRKLTFAEKQVKKAEDARLKEEKAKQKTEDQARRDEEKRLKDEEKRRKAEEREAAKKVKEVEKAEKEAARAERQRTKDAEKAEKEAERLKKERAQMRLGTFFGRPAPASTPPSTPEDVSSGVSSRRSSIASIDMERPELDAKPIKATSPEFSSWILPFFPHEHTDIAPYNRFIANHATTGIGIGWLDRPEETTKVARDSLEKKFGPAKARTKRVVPVERVVAEMSGTHDQPIDLTDSSEIGNAVELLEHTSLKVFSFREDFRPPYQGTFTRSLSPRTARRLSRNPAQRIMPKVDYDYDSEAEWEAPEAGDEDLEDEDELSDDEEAVDEMADFVDDEDEIARRRVTTTDVVPVCTGLCWEGDVAHSSIAGIDLVMYRMDVLSDDTRLPIDPYSTDHWSHPGKLTPAKSAAQSSTGEQSTTPGMQPPRLPLAAVNAPNGSPLKKFVTVTSNVNTTHAQKENEAPNASGKSLQNPKKPTKTISPDLLPAFKMAVSGSDLNKVALVEILKKQFPKCPKDAIKGTLETIAVRQGAKEADKRWVLVA